MIGVAGVTDPSYNGTSLIPTGNSFVTFLARVSNRFGFSHKDLACVPVKPQRSIATPTSNHTASAAVWCRP